jgi:hypothetical protein
MASRDLSDFDERPLWRDYFIDHQKLSEAPLSTDLHGRHAFGLG